MIDPITAVAVATSAFKTVQKMVSMGREIEDTLGQVGKWYGAVSDFNEAKRQAENPPIFRSSVYSRYDLSSLATAYGFFVHYCLARHKDI
jgi:hypothetical protein